MQKFGRSAVLLLGFDLGLNAAERAGRITVLGRRLRPPRFHRLVTLPARDT